MCSGCLRFGRGRDASSLVSYSGATLVFLGRKPRRAGDSRDRAKCFNRKFIEQNLQVSAHPSNLIEGGRGCVLFKSIAPSLALFTFAALASSGAFPQSKDQLPPALVGVRRAFTTIAPQGESGTAMPGIGTGSPTTTSFDSIPTFSGEYQVQGFGPQGYPHYKWYYTIAGRQPEKGGRTTINAPIIPVSIDLLDWDKSVRVVNGHKLHYSVKPFVQPVLESPVFANSDYTSSDVPTQFTDAIQRAEFYNVMGTDWHTLLRASIKTERTMQIPRGAYRFALHKDGSCCAYVMVDLKIFSKLFFASSATDVHSPVGAAEHAGDITAQSISTFLFPNTYLYPNSDPNLCCVLGFHSYDTEAGTAKNNFREKRYVLAFASYVNSGLFGTDFQDVTALSHEITEAVNDPFVGSDGVHGVTPWWYSLNGHCQDDLETGDVVEGLPESTVAIHLNGRTYHLQNEALLQWFEMQSPSTAIAGAYSYPNESVLTSLSPSLDKNCQ